MKTNLDTKGWEQRIRHILAPQIHTEDHHNIDPDSITWSKEGIDYKVKEIYNLLLSYSQELSLAKQQWIEESAEGIGKMKLDRKDMFYGKGEIEHGFETSYNKAISDVLSYLKGGER